VILSTILFSPASLFHKFTVILFAFLKPFGIWGLGALAILDSSSIPMPIDALVIGYIVQDHARMVLFCFMAALGSAIGSLLPYYLGRAGGELILLKRINRQRYEKLRDRFEKQEFLAIMVPAMMPPPMPVKLFELAAGVFEMRPFIYFLAILAGKFVRFLIWGILTILYGQKLLTTIVHSFHQHSGIFISAAMAILLALGIYIVRRVFDKRRGTPLPIEEPITPTSTQE
jgi:membrane protein YqaA with SNARE-associated domain